MEDGRLAACEGATVAAIMRDVKICERRSEGDEGERCVERSVALAVDCCD